jgi:hypothetical protein
VDPAGPQFIARIGGVNTPSSGYRATAGKQLIASWEGRRVDFRETCCGRPHGEIPGIITDCCARPRLNVSAVDSLRLRVHVQPVA